MMKLIMMWDLSPDNWGRAEAIISHLLSKISEGPVPLNYLSYSIVLPKNGQIPMVRSKNCS
jgi:hypothetical protein